MWTEKGNGDQDRGHEPKVNLVNDEVTREMRERARRRRIRQLELQVATYSRDYNPGGGWGDVMKALGMAAATLGIGFVVVLLIVHNVHEGREFARSCEARGGWVNEDVGGHWETVPVVTVDAKGNTSTSWQQQYQSGPTYCVVDGVNVARR